jgi:hypothetical protein
MAQWWAGPAAFQDSTKFLAPDGNLYLLLVLPISKIGPGTDSASATIEILGTVKNPVIDKINSFAIF